MRYIYVLICCAIYCTSWSQADDSPSVSPIIFIYDASGSMWGQIDGQTKIEIARGVLSDAIDGLSLERPLGLVAYGHRTKGDCEDVETIHLPQPNNQVGIKKTLQGIKPLGKTPLAKSADQVLDYLIDNSMKATIILITDGVESCGGDLCSIVKKARENGLEFKMHIVGFGLTGEDLQNLKCAANAGQGNYYDASNAQELSSVLDDAIARDVSKPVDNVAVYAEKNGQPIDAWVRAFEVDSRLESGGVRTYRDTGLFHLPVGVYDLEVRPLENSDVPSQIIPAVKVVESETVFQSISFDAGRLDVITYMNDDPCDATVKIRIPESGQQISGGRTYSRVQENDVPPGVYQVELQAIKIEGKATKTLLENVAVKGKDTTLLEYRFDAGFALIGARNSQGLVDATVNIVHAEDGTSAAGGRTYTSEASNPKQFVLTPGKYNVTLSGLGLAKGAKTSFEMTIKAKETFEKTIQF